VVAENPGTFYGQARAAGDIYTVAGDGTAGFAGDGGPATSAELNNPTAVAVDRAGNLVISDWDNNRIRVVAESTGTFYGQAMTAGDIYTVAGNGVQGFSGDGGPATSAELDRAVAALDGSGNLIIADNLNNRIRVVAEATGTFYGVPMTAGDIYTVAGDGTAGFAGDGGPATSAELDQPTVVVADAAGNLIIADWLNNRIRVVAEATGTFDGVPMTAGDIYTIAGNGRRAFSGDGGPATQAEISGSLGLTTDGSNLVFADSGNNRLRMITG
jgi:trimeric autotransporter adhesin